MISERRRIAEYIAGLHPEDRRVAEQWWRVIDAGRAGGPDINVTISATSEAQARRVIDELESAVRHIAASESAMDAMVARHGDPRQEAT